jgi:hypothetical protein
MPRVYAAYARNIVQMGKETTAGTGVAADTVWRGPFAMIEDTEEQVVLEEQIGNLYGAEEAFTRMYGGRLSLPETALTFQHVGILLDAGIQAATPGAATAYTRTYNDVPGTVNVPSTWTIETGNFDSDDDSQRMVHAFCEEFQLSAQAGQEWRMSSTWVGRQTLQNALTAAVALQTVNVASLPMTKLYIDASGGTVKTTQKTGVLMGATLRRRTGFQPIPVGDGTRYYGAIKQVAPEATFSLTIEVEKDTTSLVSAERAIWRSRGIRLFCLDIVGDNADNNLEIQWAGRYSKVSGYENLEGNTVVTLEGRVVYLPAKSLFQKFILKSGVAVL